MERISSWDISEEDRENILSGNQVNIEEIHCILEPEVVVSAITCQYRWYENRVFIIPAIQPSSSTNSILLWD